MARLTMKAVAVTLLLIIGIGCHKEVIVHHASPNGLSGTASTPAGAILYSGPLYPPAQTGKAGDYFLNVSDSTLFGPKTSFGWGTGRVLSADPGEGGDCQMFSGSGVPSSTLGNPGDFYLDLATGDLFGPKTFSGWAPGVSLIGVAPSSPDSIE
jgi:hypothetical protein